MTLTENKQIVRRYIEEIWNLGNLDLLETLVDPHIVRHTMSPITGGETGGRSALKIDIANIRNAFSDLNMRIDDLIAENEKVVVRWLITGLNTATLWNMEPHGNRVNLTGISIFRLSEGKIIEMWNEFDHYIAAYQILTSDKTS
ncbi:hypothetical protein DO97_08380 [Neosynechococcus sphagnicola sy1]|uniref:Ester cyclase n=1 Tax=Neosynechococcus sphagnicola sy1 TaxID=1497020 RepID=A0A098TIL4_9CYAN|nr:ester cyclase [Neosynechococcus sphagnicola]KGF72405.1 hypothetical protein DO97_08380 [Neosynechococcus sphagnicola sy1]